MSDYIDRNEAIEAVDGNLGDWNAENWAVSIIMRLPSADVEPVVRCKACKHRCGDYCHNDDGFAHFDHFVVQDDDYCSRGEREDGDANAE